MNLFTTFRIVVIAWMLAFAGQSFGQPDVVDTAERDFKKADAEMNAMYQKVLSALAQDTDHGKIHIANLKKAQRAWLAFRDAEATARAGASSDGGSAYSMDYLANLKILTIYRTKELAELFLGKTLKNANELMGIPKTR